MLARDIRMVEGKPPMTSGGGNLIGGFLNR
jgi:hypothetical protein